MRKFSQNQQNYSNGAREVPNSQWAPREICPKPSHSERKPVVSCETYDDDDELLRNISLVFGSV